MVVGCRLMVFAIVMAALLPLSMLLIKSMFIGLAVPHLARAMFRTSDHRWLMPATLFSGMLLTLICSLLSRLPGFEGALPVNSVAALVGAPIVAMMLIKRK